MDTTVKIQNATIHTVGKKPKEDRKVFPLLRRVTFLAFLGSAFYLVPQAVDVGVAVYTDLKVPRAQTPIPQGSATWISNDEPLVWEEAAKDLDPEWNKRSDVFNPLGLLTLFKDLKMTEQQKLLVTINYKVATEQYILSADEPQLRAFLEHRNTNAREWLDNAWEKIQEQMLTGETVSLPINDIAKEQLEHDKINMNVWQDDATKQTHTIYELLSRGWESVYVDLSERAAPTTEQQARQNLTHAVQDSGLAALVVSGVVANAPHLMNAQAINLQQANIDLRRTTGLQGGVLGVNHRVILHNEYINSDGSMQTLDNGYLLIKSSWKTLGHEWFHAFDAGQISAIKGRGYANLVSTYLNRPTLNAYRDRYNLHAKQQKLHDEILKNPIDSVTQPQLLKEVAARDAQRYKGASVMVLALDRASQQALHDGAQQNAKNWSQYRTLAADFAKEYSLNDWAKKNKLSPTIPQNKLQWEKEKEYAVRYLSSPTEKMAFLFQGHLEALSKTGQSKILNGEMRGESGVYVPTVAESFQNTPYWNNYFASLQNWWTDDMQKRHVAIPPTLSKANIVDSRSKLPSLPPLPPLPPAP